MKTHRSRSAALALAASLATGTAAFADTEPDAIDLGLRHRVGDRYALSLGTDTHTEIDTRGARGKGFREDVTLRYAATVEVLEVDAHGMPVRERHEGAELRFTRPDGKGSLFREGATFEVVHKEDAIALYHFGARVEPRIEAIVGDLLAHQMESSVGRLVDPGRPVAIGERWPLDPARVGPFLTARGLHGADLDGTPTAELRGGEGEPLRVHYEIPVGSFELREMPDASHAKRSRGSLKGALEIAAGPAHRPVAHASALEFRMNGEFGVSGETRPASFVLSRSQSVDQRTETLRDQLASTH